LHQAIIESPGLDGGGTLPGLCRLFVILENTPRTPFLQLHRSLVNVLVFIN